MAVLQVHHIKLSAPALEQISKIMTAGMGPNCKGGNLTFIYPLYVQRC